MAAALPATASAGQFKRDSAVDAKTRGLEPAQRKALDIIGVDITKTQYLAKVIVRFKGNFERQMRTPKLKKAGALIQLSFKSSSATVSGFGLPHPFAAAARRTTVASVGAGKRMKTIGGLGPGGPFAAVRKGRELTFWIGGINAYRLAKVEARSFQGPARRKARARGANAEDVLRPLLKAAESDRLLALITGTELRTSVDCKRLRSLVNTVDDTADDLSDGIDDLSDEKQAEAREEVAEMRRLARRGEAFLAGPPCTPPGGTGGGGNTGGGGSGTPAPAPSATDCPLVATAVNKPNPPGANLDTNVHGQCNGAWDYYDLEVTDGGTHKIEGWIAHANANTPCEAYDQNGQKYTQNPDGSVNPPTPTSYIAKLRCFNKGDNLIDIDLDIAPDPSNNTPIKVTVYRGGAALFAPKMLTR